MAGKKRIKIKKEAYKEIKREDCRTTSEFSAWLSKHGIRLCEAPPANRRIKHRGGEIHVCGEPNGYSDDWEEDE